MIYHLYRTDHVNYDENAGFVIRAGSEQEAREQANLESKYGDEGKIWTDPTRVTCEEIKPDGDTRAFLRDFHAG